MRKKLGVLSLLFITVLSVSMLLQACGSSAKESDSKTVTEQLTSTTFYSPEGTKEIGYSFDICTFKDDGTLETEGEDNGKTEIYDWSLNKAEDTVTLTDEDDNTMTFELTFSDDIIFLKPTDPSSDRFIVSDKDEALELFKQSDIDEE